MLPSNIKIGIIGGGQLGKMLIEAGKPWNIHYNILDAENAPAKDIANQHIIGSLYDAEKIRELASISDVLTYEIEHINIDVLFELEKEGKKIIPSPSILHIIQDKGLQKQFFKNNDIPSASFELVENTSEWREKIKHLKGNKIAAKLRKGGYDGKGVELIKIEQIQNPDYKFLMTEPCVLEEFVENAIELSVIVSRDAKGNIKSFPLVEMEFNPISNLVEYLFSPAEVSKDVEIKCENIAKDCIEKLNGVGIFAVEMFLNTQGEVFVNEIAPRPHNSGHHTIEACYTSQYEQLNRILLGMPLGSTELIQPAAMINILGAENVDGYYELTGLNEILNIAGVYVHLYNKNTSKPMRKMGHITILAKTAIALKEKAKLVKNALGMKLINK
ncbi:MAG: 5-(carboxyamino)imidazole ribonucleotide synthase [Bacteroidota bacterium]|nr:5-(carboxyamino)imidazole ribonucleotide synthase [Bacteroidota bacterium]